MTRNKLVLLGLITISIFISGCSNDYDDSGSSGGSYSGGKYYACAVAEKEVKAQLKSQSSAKFPNCDDMTITNSSGDKWVVSSYVESENSFGAMIKTNFVMSFERTGEDTYISDGVIFDE